MLVLLGCWAFTPEASWADETDFRVETRVFAAEVDEPVSSNVTIFHAEKIYDFKANRPIITIFEPAAGQLTLLDTKRQVKAILTTTAIELLVGRLKATALQRDDPLVKFAAQPQFKTTFGRNQLRLVGSQLSFRVATHKPQNTDAVGHYRQYADSYAKFNSIRPGGLPPFARLALNRELAERGVLPKSIELVLQRTDPKTHQSSVTRFRSEHDFSWRLTDADLHKIESARSHRAQFHAVELAQFLRGQSRTSRRPGEQKQ